MKRNTIAAAAAAFLCILILGSALTVRADVVFEPDYSDFYMEHRDECTTVNEVWETNAAGGVRVMEDPESDKIIYEFDKIGERMSVLVLYNGKDGSSWVFTEFFRDGKRYEGWVPQNLLWRSYDSDQFFRDYRSQVREESGDAVTTDEDMEILFYTYPGSDASFTVQVSGGDYMPGYWLVYEDEKGRTWGCVDYYYAQSGWVCIDEPQAGPEELWPEGLPKIDPRERMTYEIVYHEDSTEIRENPEDVTSKETSASEEESSTSAEESSSSAEESSTSAEESSSSAEESSSSAEESSEETSGEPPKDPSSFRFSGWMIALPVAGVVIVTGAILLAVLLRKKKKK